MNNKITFNTGYTLEFRPISRVKIAKINLAVRKEFEKCNESLDPPTYYTVEPTKENPDGVTEPHNETTLMTDEDKAAWTKYQFAINRLIEEQTLRVCKYLLLKGIITDITPTEEWIKEEKALDTELPENEDDLKLEYLYDEILVSERNIGEAVAKPLALGLEGTISDMEVEAIEDTFRGDMESRQKEKTINGTDQVAKQET